MRFSVAPLEAEAKDASRMHCSGGTGTLKNQSSEFKRSFTLGSSEHPFFAGSV